MGVYNSALITTTVWADRISSMVNYLNSIDGITALEERNIIDNQELLGAKFTFDDKGIEGFFGYNSFLQITGIYLKNINIGADIVTPQIYGNNYQDATNVKIQYYLDNNVIFVCIGDMMNGYRHKLEVGFVNTVNSITLFGYGSRFSLNSNNDPLFDMADLTFNVLDDSARVPYTYINMYPYIATAGTIEYTNEGIFVNDGIKMFSTEALKECSTVTLQSTQSLLSGVCVALGTHCLAPLNIEGDD